MKRRTKKQKFDDLADAIQCIREGKKVKRLRAKDGSIPTKPVVPCPYLPEHEVLGLCLGWLKKRKIFHNRMNNGTFEIGGRWCTYGIKGAGDILGIIPGGRHFEVEVKKGKGGKLSVAQQKRMQDVRANGGLYVIVHG
ncbi:hypothetical protein LCGC14_2275550, partial [marine sediment metagenome]